MLARFFMSESKSLGNTILNLTCLCFIPLISIPELEEDRCYQIGCTKLLKYPIAKTVEGSIPKTPK